MGDTIAAQAVFKDVLGGGPVVDIEPRPARTTPRHSTAPAMGNRIEMRLGNILDEATRVLHEHRHMVLAIAHALGDPQDDLR